MAALMMPPHVSAHDHQIVSWVSQQEFVDQLDLNFAIWQLNRYY